MGVFFVGYEIRNGTDADREGFAEAIQRLTDSYWHCLKSTWLITHDGPAEAIRDALLPYLVNPTDEEQGDKLLVATMNKGVAFTPSFCDDCQDWLLFKL